MRINSSVSGRVESGGKVTAADMVNVHAHAGHEKCAYVRADMKSSQSVPAVGAFGAHAHAPGREVDERGWKLRCAALQARYMTRPPPTKRKKLCKLEAAAALPPSWCAALEAMVLIDNNEDFLYPQLVTEVIRSSWKRRLPEQKLRLLGPARTWVHS